MNNIRFGWWKRACALCVLCGAAAIASPAQMFTTLVNFNETDGAGPFAGVVQGTDGNLYGTTAGGGVSDYGTVFKVTPAGTLTTLYSFCSQTGCTDGAEPDAGLVLAGDGNFYGTTAWGGNDACDDGCGTVFKITPPGALTTVYSFCAQPHCTDGSYPYGALVQGTDGNLYGTTGEGGNETVGCGTVFKVTPGGLLTTLHRFDYTDGCSPQTGLVQAIDGDFYGTTIGGFNNRGTGTIFKVSPGGVFASLHVFDMKEGEYPSTLIQAADGNFYGTTPFGGANDSSSCSVDQYTGCGTIFKITPSGTLTTVLNFDYDDGAGPSSALIQASNGSFYGATEGGGAYNSCYGGCGVIFELSSQGVLRTLYSLNSTDGYQSRGLFQATDGIVYGTTAYGPANGECESTGCGTVFSLAAGLRPFVETIPSSGKIGAAVKILGTNLTGSTSVTFNGTAATFKVSSASLITTTVPAGATSGTVQVVTPGGTLSSNVSFRVLP